MNRPFLALVLATAGLGASALVACGSDAEPVPDDGLTFRSEVQPVTRVEDALPGVHIPAFVDCRAPAPGDAATNPGGEVCTAVSIAGATEPGKAFEDYASCDVVRTQRPYWPAPPADLPEADDPRHEDAALVAELAWARGEIAATGCVCCHDARLAPAGASQWDLAAGPLWLDTLSDAGLALFGGYADSSVLGAYPADENHGFDRTATGVPTTDGERMRALVRRELERRGIDEAEARAVPPFGGPIYDASIRPPTTCGPGEGVAPDGTVHFRGEARYVYVAEAGSKNPGVPPNLDRPEGTIWRLDVLPNRAALGPGFAYATTPAGSFQDLPADRPAPGLEAGRAYHLTVLEDVGLPITSCLFTFGEPLPEAPPPPVADTDPDPGFGAPCDDDAGCAAPAGYCAKQPGSATGTCTATGCTDDPSVCPEGWGCFDLSVFQDGAPSICTAP